MDITDTVFLLLPDFLNARFIYLFFKLTFGNIDLPYSLQYLDRYLL
jgi:hypothetical protein